MRYTELSLAVRPEAVEAAADVLRRQVPGGVSIEPAYRASDLEGGVSLDGDAPVRLRAWLPARGARGRIEALRAELRALDGVVTPLRTRAVADEAWATAWKRYYPVVRVGRRLVIKPSWRRHRARRDDVVIELDPGMAFGTGQHPTTRMCLEALEERLRPGACVLDVGAGSGVLGIAAALLGAARVDAVDVDPVAVRATRENARRNGVSRRVRAREGSVGQAWPFAERATRRYDLVLGNLSSRLVQELARHLVRALADGGVAIVSGLIGEHEAACVGALERAGGRVVETRREGEWRLLVVRRAG